MNKLEEEITQSTEIIEYVTKNMCQLDATSQLIMVQATFEFANKLKPLFAKLKNNNQESFMIRL